MESAPEHNRLVNTEWPILDPQLRGSVHPIEAVARYLGGCKSPCALIASIETTKLRDHPVTEYGGYNSDARVAHESMVGKRDHLRSFAEPVTSNGPIFTGATHFQSR